MIIQSNHFGLTTRVVIGRLHTWICTHRRTVSSMWGGGSNRSLRTLCTQRCARVVSLSYLRWEGQCG